VVNYTTVTNLTIQQPDFDLLCHTLSLLSHSVTTSKGPCLANLHRRGVAETPICECGQQHTNSHGQHVPLTSLKVVCNHSMRQKIRLQT